MNTLHVLTMLPLIGVSHVQRYLSGTYDGIPQDSVVISLGVHDEISFESDLQNITNTCCNIFGFDDREQSPKTQQRLSELRGRSIKANMSGTTEEQKGNYAIDYLVKLENVTHVEILKIDIEGGEMDLLPGLLEKQQPAQIMIKIHHSPPVMASLLKLISRHGYWLLSHEIDGMFHDASDFSFIHVCAFAKYGAVPLAKYLSCKDSK